MREDYLNRLSNIDISLSHNLFLHYTTYHADLFAAFDQYAKGRLLDIGCGNKPYATVLNTKISDYTGADIIQSNENCVDILCPANAIPVPDNAFDTVISTQTIEHVEYPQGLVNEAYRTLKPGGYFILSAPMYWPLHEEPYDFFRYTKYGLTCLLQTADFEVIDVRSNGGKWAVAGQALIHALYPTVYNMKGIKGKVFRSINYLLGGVKTVNRFFFWIDRKVPDHTNTMNYVIIALKR